MSWKAGAALAAAGVAVGVVVGAVGYAAVADDDGDQADDGSSLGESAEEQPQAGSWDPEVQVFLDRDVTEDERAAIEELLADDDRVEAFDYLDQDESVEEFRDLFERNQAMLDRIEQNPDLLPAFFRVTLTSTGQEETDAFASDLRNEPGVSQVSAPPTCEDLMLPESLAEQSHCRP